jgi:hypothetical protein
MADGFLSIELGWSQNGARKLPNREIFHKRFFGEILNDIEAHLSVFRIAAKHLSRTAFPA